jgi:signal transduction histidine kinase
MLLPIRRWEDRDARVARCHRVQGGFFATPGGPSAKVRVLPREYAADRPAADDGASWRGYRPLVTTFLAKAPAALRDFRLRPRDIRIAAVAAAIQIGGTAGASGHGYARGRHGCWWASSCKAPTHLDAAAFVLLAIGPVALLARRRHPRAVLAVAFVASLLYVALGYLQGPNYASLVIAFVTVVLAGDRLAAWVALAAGWALFLWVPAALGLTSTPTVLAVFAIGAWLFVVLAAGEALRGRKERAAESRRARQQEARRRADEERLRIARELHDVLAHNISLINVQSGVALHLIDEKPEQARIALSAINEASADALREVRSALSVLRGTEEQPPRAPTAGLDRLDELASRATAAGVDVSVEVSGHRRPLPASVDLAAFRIVQESLTNIVRHASASTATVRLSYTNGEVTVQIDDDGTGAGGEGVDSGGSGIAGMRERATALGGDLDAGRLSTGGFRVRARLPLPAERGPAWSGP